MRQPPPRGRASSAPVVLLCAPLTEKPILRLSTFSVAMLVENGTSVQPFSVRRVTELTLTAPVERLMMSSQSRLIQQKQSEQAYKRLMTSLSHDVKTPLASLVGYLEAVESKMVTGAEQEEYIRVAAEKAHHLKEFVTVLFEWVKLDAGEQIFHFELCDLNELSRNIMADWVPLLESHDLTYEIEIPETEYMTRVDSTAYTRILNNLLQNILTHSVASQVSLTVTETEQQAKIVVADNGKGISISDLPHIFERMYQCDHSRAAKGNGLGLSIAKELVSVHKGTITAASIPGAGTTFTIMLPKAL